MSILENFLDELEQILAKHYNQDWNYTFDVEDSVSVALTIPNNDREGECNKDRPHHRRSSLFRYPRNLQFTHRDQPFATLVEGGYLVTEVTDADLCKVSLTDVDLQSIYESYLYWIDDVEQQEDWWAGHGYDTGKFTFDINFVLGYESDDLEDRNDFGVWLYPVSPPAYQVHSTGIDVTDEFKAYLATRSKESM